MSGVDFPPLSVCQHFASLHSPGSSKSLSEDSAGSVVGEHSNQVADVSPLLGKVLPCPNLAPSFVSEADVVPISNFESGKEAPRALSVPATATDSRLGVLSGSPRHPFLSKEGDSSSTSHIYPSPLLGMSALASWPISSFDGVVPTQLRPEHLVNLPATVLDDDTEMAANVPRVMQHPFPNLPSGFAADSISASLKQPMAPNLSTEPAASPPPAS
ncbi:hypothetical protein Nepgr_018808 [Nepenthes gracilis]|uniref:Uncharacterized protein n=1 Tax=Nepenthes gracilis TaxID=150966 RepID=A0AAD3SUS8_NEPGR|nr:hypothetical protein Nepgr_018808 [Nepenthes gracilis]